MSVVDEDVGFKKRIECEKMVTTEIGCSDNV